MLKRTRTLDAQGKARTKDWTLKDKAMAEDSAFQAKMGPMT